jgi:hypothetical protein
MGSQANGGSLGEATRGGMYGELTGPNVGPNGGLNASEGTSVKGRTEGLRCGASEGVVQVAHFHNISIRNPAKARN